VKAWWLRHALTPKPKASDTRPFFTRLLASIRLDVKWSIKKGITYLGIRGGTDF